MSKHLKEAAELLLGAMKDKSPYFKMGSCLASLSNVGRDFENLIEQINDNSITLNSLLDCISADDEGEIRQEINRMIASNNKTVSKAKGE